MPSGRSNMSRRNGLLAGILAPPVPPSACHDGDDPHVGCYVNSGRFLARLALLHRHPTSRTGSCHWAGSQWQCGCVPASCDRSSEAARLTNGRGKRSRLPLVIVVVVASISLSAIAAIQLSTQPVSQSLEPVHNLHKTDAFNFEQCMDFPQPIALRRPALVARRLEIIQCFAW